MNAEEAPTEETNQEPLSLGLPAYLPVAEVARHAGVATDTYERYLRRKGVTRRMGNDRVVNSDKLKEVEPNVYERVFAARMMV